MNGAAAAVFPLAIGGVAAAADAEFSNTFTTGSIVVGVIVIAVAGFFTIRANVAKTWHENYDAEVVKRKEAEDRVQELLNAIHAEREREASIRHELKDEIASTKALLEVEKLKPNLGVIVEMATEHYATAMRDVTAMFEGVTRTQAQMQQALGQITEQLATANRRKRAGDP